MTHPDWLREVDDALARALGDLAEANLRVIFSQAALNAVLRDGIEARTLHADTTPLITCGLAGLSR